MDGFKAREEQDRLVAEIEALQRWAHDLMEYVNEGLLDPAVSQEEFSNAATMSVRVLMRLKALYDRTSAQDSRFADRPQQQGAARRDPSAPGTGQPAAS